MKTLEEFYQKLISRQNNSQRWNAVVCDIIELYNYKFLVQDIFNEEELWDFLFTQREDHREHHGKIWDTFYREKYNEFFSIVFVAMDDPETSWWRELFKDVTRHS
jgi:hypothetical protein